jgi:hypothetical protein
VVNALFQLLVVLNAVNHTHPLGKHDRKGQHNLIYNRIKQAQIHCQ